MLEIFGLFGRITVTSERLGGYCGAQTCATLIEEQDLIT
jgi:hypothetical protein